jgi:hypothetical protein
LTLENNTFTYHFEMTLPKSRQPSVVAFVISGVSQFTETFQNVGGACKQQMLMVVKEDSDIRQG